MYLSDIAFDIDQRDDGTFIVRLAGGREASGVSRGVLHTIANVPGAGVRTTPPDEHVPNGDPLDQLEADSANTESRGQVSMMHDLQDIVAEQFLMPLNNDGVVSGVTSDEMFEMALWLNRRGLTIHQVSEGDESHPMYLADIASFMWSGQLLEATS